MITSIKLNNILSFGSQSKVIPLGKLNVIIGPNGSGKSNFIESIALLQSAPSKLSKSISEGGGLGDFLWKGSPGSPVASLDVTLGNLHKSTPLRYVLAFTAVNQRLSISDERVEDASPVGTHHAPYFYYHFNNGSPTLNVSNKTRSLQHEDIDLNSSILSQRRDPDQYPEITKLALTFDKIMLYREWSFGRSAVLGAPQKTDLPNNTLEPDASNLGLVLNHLCENLEIKKRFISALQLLYEGIEDFGVSIHSGTVQIFLHEKIGKIPTTRLSDGTRRYLFLLAILLNPTPPPLVCIEEPELGLHPDILPTLAELLKEASQKCQLIVTTHSDILVDAMTDQPDSVLVCEKHENGTELTRLDEKELKPWLEKYRLGELWTRGDLGGNRW